MHSRLPALPPKSTPPHRTRCASLPSGDLMLALWCWLQPGVDKRGQGREGRTLVIEQLRGPWDKAGWAEQAGCWGPGLPALVGAAWGNAPGRHGDPESPLVPACRDSGVLPTPAEQPCPRVGTGAGWLLRPSGRSSLSCAWSGSPDPVAAQGLGSPTSHRSRWTVGAPKVGSAQEQVGGELGWGCSQDLPISSDAGAAADSATSVSLVGLSRARCQTGLQLLGPPCLTASNLLLSFHAVLGGQSESKYLPDPRPVVPSPARGPSAQPSPHPRVPTALPGRAAASVSFRNGV